MCHSAVWRLACASDCCCSLFRMMLMMSPSCSFMCSISRSLLVDSKPQMQQQNKSTQYSMPGPGGGSWPVREWLWDWDWSCAGSFPWGLTDSGDHFEGSVGGVEKPTGLSADRTALLADVGVSGGSAVLFALSFERGDTAGRSATDSTTADNFWGALKEAEGKIMRWKIRSLTLGYWCHPQRLYGTDILQGFFSSPDWEDGQVAVPAVLVVKSKNKCKVQTNTVV